MSYYKTPAIVIKTINYKDADKIITFFTKNFGKISVIGKGIRKTKKRNLASLDLFSYSDIIIYGRNKEDFYILSHIDLIKSFYSLTQDSNKIAATIYAIQFVNDLLDKKIKSEILFDLLITTLYQIEERQSLENLIFAFSLKFLKELGYKIQLSRCVSCNKDILAKSNSKFSIKLGGVICYNCNKEDTSAFEISNGTIFSFNKLQNLKLDSHLLFSELNKEEFKKFFYPFIEFHLGVKIKSIEEIQKEIGLYKSFC